MYLGKTNHKYGKVKIEAIKATRKTFSPADFLNLKINLQKIRTVGASTMQVKSKDKRNFVSNNILTALAKEFLKETRDRSQKPFTASFLLNYS